MRSTTTFLTLALAAAAIAIPVAVTAQLAPPPQQLSPGAAWAATMATQYQYSPNVSYRTASGQEIKLDVYSRRDVQSAPTLVYYHGGFWVAGDKEGAMLALMPWLEMGWNVVNVEYRLGPAVPAPAAVDDSFCALRFIAARATNYRIDLNRIVVTGESAGGHLALAMGMIPESEGFGKNCGPIPAGRGGARGAAAPAGPRGADAGGAAGPPARGAAPATPQAPSTPPAPAGADTPLPKIAAIINWFGITDVPDVIDGPNKKQPAASWFGDMPPANALALAKRLSPLTHVRPGLPPVLTIHGGSDTTVPYPEAQRLHEALEKVKVPNQLITIPGAGHGGFNAESRLMIYANVREFLTKNGIAIK